VFVFKWKWTMVFVFVTMVGLVTTGVYVLPETYRATAAVIVEPMKSPSIRVETYAGRVETAEIINTEMAIAASRTVMTNVVDRLRLPERPRRDTVISRTLQRLQATLADLGLVRALDRRERWIRGLMADVTVKPTVSSNVFTIRYEYEDPQMAADIVNGVTDEYFSRHVTIYSDKGVVDFYRKQMDQAKAKLDVARADLERYKAEKTLAAAAARKDRLVTEVTGVRERISRMNLELTEVAARFGNADQRAALLREKLRTSADEMTRLQLQLEELERAEAKALAMEVGVKAQEKTYLAYRDGFDHASLSTAANENVANVRILDYADVPARPMFSRLFLILVAALAGTVLAVLIAMVREYFDHRVMTPTLAEEILGVPVLGSIERGRI
jgi:uncharacterized protein involved in exopolysaccharide biosynthesis